MEVKIMLHVSNIVPLTTLIAIKLVVLHKYKYTIKNIIVISKEVFDGYIEQK